MLDGAAAPQPGTLAALRVLPGQLSVGDRLRIVQQAIVLLEDLYVHLPLKRAMYAQDAVQALRLLATRLDGLTDAQFHSRMLPRSPGCSRSGDPLLPPMRFTSPPDEDWVVVSYTDVSKRFDVRLDWQIVDTDSPASSPVLSLDRRRRLFSSPHAVDATDSSSGVTESLGIDAREEVIRRTRKVLFAPAAMAQEAEMEVRGAASAATAAPPEGTSVMPDVFAVRTVASEGGRSATAGCGPSTCETPTPS